jgi:hypothetical protein
MGSIRLAAAMLVVVMIAGCASLPPGHPSPPGWYGQNPDPRARRPGPHGRFDPERPDPGEPFPPPPV